MRAYTIWHSNCTSERDATPEGGWTMILAACLAHIDDTTCVIEAGNRCPHTIVNGYTNDRFR